MKIDPFNVMIDLESLSTEPHAVILSLGATLFRVGSGKVPPGQDTFYARVIDPETQLTSGRHLKMSTLRWWMQQDKDSQVEAFPIPITERSLKADPITDLNVMSTLEMLDQFKHYLWGISQGGKSIGLWANGADFDCVILASLYRTYGQNPPWEFRQNRCYRTMKNLCPDVPRPENTAKHNALSDAINQAIHLNDILDHLS